jgi:hypothetical protein
MRGFVELGTVAPEITPAEVIDQKEYKVWELFRGQARRCKKSEYEDGGE